MNKTCFVISPIGEKDSDVRKRSDAVYDLIIEPALEKFDFDVTRADKNLSISSITSEVVQLVQDSDLCIIDITDHNPNVMYECGRRHETAKPYIMIAAEGEKLPFDITTIRTIFYNLSDAREIRGTVKTLQSIIAKMLEGGLEPERSGESLSTLSDTLTRIERKIDRISTAGAVGGTAGTVSTPNTAYQEVLNSLGLTGAFNYALTQRDIGLAEFLLPNLRRQLPTEKYIDWVLTQAAPMGSAVAHRELVGLFDGIDSWDKDLKRDIIGSLVAGFVMGDQESEGLALMSAFFSAIRIAEAPSADLSTKDKAFYLNQLQKLLYGSEEYQEALAVGKEVLALSPDDPSYIFNYSLLCEKTKQDDEAYRYVKKLFSIMQSESKYDDDHLSRVVQVFAENNDPSIHEAFIKLQEVNPYRATMLLRDEHVKKAING